jgi:hypothetical protein
MTPLERRRIHNGLRNLIALENDYLRNPRRASPGSYVVARGKRHVTAAKQIEEISASRDEHIQQLIALQPDAAQSRASRLPMAIFHGRGYATKFFGFRSR